MVTISEKNCACNFGKPWTVPAAMQAAYYFFHNRPPLEQISYVLEADPAIPLGQPGHWRLVQAQNGGALDFASGTNSGLIGAIGL